MTKHKSTNKDQSAAATPATTSPTDRKGKLGAIIALLMRSEGATLAHMQAATGWQVHSLRGVMSGNIKKKLGLTITSEKSEAGRVYRIVNGAA